jgi:hypothetical protein
MTIKHRFAVMRRDQKSHKEFLQTVDDAITKVRIDHADYDFD